MLSTTRGETILRRTCRQVKAAPNLSDWSQGEPMTTRRPANVDARPNRRTARPAVKIESLDAEARYTIEEARMVLPGIQAIFGFQLIAVFNQRFHDLTDTAT